MAYLKWQQIVKYGGTGLVSLFVVLVAVLNLVGMSNSDDGDKVCMDCFSEIQIKSTYWEIKVEENGADSSLIRKKTVRGRTLWLNLDRIEELVTTDPNIKVDILIPAIKRTSSMKHDEYGYLRELKDGDTFIHRNTKSRPSPSRIIIHGKKGAFQTVKWSFDLESFMMENINIDPVWLSLKDRITKDILIAPGIIEIRTCNLEYYQKDVFENVTYQRDTIGMCFFNISTDVIHCKNLTGPNTDCSTIGTDFNYGSKSCKTGVERYEVLEKVGQIIKSNEVNCRTIGIKTRGLTLMCPEDYRCDIIGDEFCMLNRNDGDRNFNAKQNKGRGWDFVCPKIADLREGEIPISGHKKLKAIITR